MNKKEIEAIVQGIVRVVLRMSPDDPEVISRKSTAIWDSLKHIEIMFAVEERLALEFSAAELAGLDSIGKIVDAAERLLSNR